MSEPITARTQTRTARMNTKVMVSMAMLTAIAYIVMLMSKLMPSVMFLDFDFKDVVICIAGFTFGPLSAAIISILVAFIEMISISTTGIIGFIMNALATCAFCCTASFVYKKMHTKKGAVLGLSLGVVCLVVVMLLWNYLITPMYMVGFSRADVAALLPTLFLPFNLAKGGMNMAATLLLYAPVVTALRKAGVVPPSQNSQGKKMNAGFVLFSFALLATFVVFALVLAGVI
ncbi:ECF transporter S component [Pseudoflavonifractor sp. AF19-9AC]|uniref:ECF transporter S component n=1 Tax=Pseudoflavonifractor sp. AF19-9AC TaxID=2292244 RepID=UPI001FAA2BB5|nr:ECF transporter S component [Pseudoflavonifractor sp. AF19-9AC]